jgi:DNA-binding LacI/PurR family transcriptional regulator
MTTCPHCGSAEQQAKAGLHGGNQRYQCAHCRRRYTPEPKPRGYPEGLRRQALTLHTEGLSVREIGLQLDINPQSIYYWLRHRTQEEPSDSKAPSTDAAPTDMLTPRRPRPTIDDVAARAEVSRSTVSNYLNDKGRMSAATRISVQTAMEALHFTPSALTRAIYRRRTSILGVLIYGLGNLDRNVGRGVPLHLLAGISEAADMVGHNLLLYTGWPNHAERHSALEFLDGHIDGLIWVAPGIDAPMLGRLADAQLPVVALLTRHVPAGIGFVNAENIGGTAALVAHLAERGHRRIAWLGSSDTTNSNFYDRREGYRRGLLTANLAHDLALDLVQNWSREMFRQAIETWVSMPDPPTAIVTPDDDWAAAVGKAVLAHGLRVPEDIAIVGFNDVPDAQGIAGGLTTIRQPLRQMGQMAVEQLMALIAGTSASDCRLTLPTEIVVRRSSHIFRQ